MGEKLTPEKRKPKKLFKKIGAVVLAVLGLSLIADTISCYEVWPSDSNGIGSINSDGGKTGSMSASSGHHNGAMCLVVPGLGVQSGEKIARALGPSLGTKCDVTYVRYSNNSLDLNDIRQRIEKYYFTGGYEELIVFGHSIGGAEITEIGPQLENDGVEISEIYLDGSPYDSDSVEGAGNLAVKVESTIPYRGGFISKFMAQLYQWTLGSERRNNHNLWWQIKDAWNSAKSESSPRTWTSQLRFLDIFSKSRHKPVKANVTYLTPEDPNIDNVVDNPDAISKFMDLYDDLTVAYLNTVRHADPGNNPGPYDNYLRNKKTPAERGSR